MENSKTFMDYYGEYVFGDEEMKKRLPAYIYKALHKSIEEGKELDYGVADKVAMAMKDWAIEKGATHYTHWFQPLTGFTAEKQDSFISSTDSNGEAIAEFSGKQLVIGESDASSLPSGGLRATFEARGYTAWDTSSPAFIRKDALGATLCIPTVYSSYTGEALDFKTPLLRSMEVINRESLRLIRLLGNKKSKKVFPMVGAEQEYFLVDKEIYNKRKDLVFTDRTLFGVMPPKGQELDDHYFGNINERVGSYMKDVNEELWKMGIPAKTQHNEAAPGQHELAPIYETCNIAVDHNQIIMRTLMKVAERHGLKCILHEKPFNGVNGSGKHNNWSLVTDDGENLLKPGKKPHENIQFLLILTCVLKAVDEYADLIRETAANIGNEYRLGGDEAPPSIISVFLGEQLENILNQYISKGKAEISIAQSRINADVKEVATIRTDSSDRNRTSPFAFTGNKFEFRMLGSKDSISETNIVLNTIVADAFAKASNELEKATDVQKKAKELICKYAKEHKRIIFNGNGYSVEWEKEAAKRGLSNIKSMVDAIPVLIDPKTVDLFERNKVYSYNELKSRYEIQLSMYSKMMHIEARAMIDIAGKLVIPAVIKYIKNLSEINLPSRGSKAIKSKAINEILVQTNGLLDKTYSAYKKLKKLIDSAEKLNIEDPETATFYNVKIKPAMENLRTPIDELELIVDKEIWPMPSYGDLLFKV